ncbi:MAG: hypothetical protein LBK58_03840 [Prevotellaceae bacterium]|jgi:hypothetical protein|nr:hypothetical protein [Prevotellaceae bacterium]
MKKIKFLIMSFALLILSGAAQAQVTPQAVIGNAPPLPAPEQWAANGGHTEAFRAKIAELNGKLNEIQAAMIPDATPDEMMKAQQQRQERQREQGMKAARQGMEAMAAMGITEADMIKMQSMSEKEIEAFMRQKMSASPEMQVLASMGITEADMKKMEKMNEKQSGAYMKKRLAENGFTEAEFRHRMEKAGVKMLSEEETKEEQRREHEAEAQGEAIAKVQEALEAYMEQMQVTGGRIAKAEKSASDRIADLRESRRDAIQKAQAEANQWEEVMRGTLTKEQVESAGRRAQSLVNDYRAAACQVWHEYILAAQGHLKFLMPYAQAADDAKKMQSATTSTGNATLDRLPGMSNNAISVAAQYLGITESEPNVNL